MKIYIDHLFHCYIEPSDDRREFNVEFFDNKCKEFIEGYNYIPPNEKLIREDGEVFYGEAYYPNKEYETLIQIQEKQWNKNKEIKDAIPSEILTTG